MTTTESTSTTKHEFKFYDGYSRLNKKLMNSVVKKVNESNRVMNVAQLDDFDPDFFIVRVAHPGVHVLYSELKRNIVENLGFITLSATDDETKKVYFGVWKRLRASQILR